MLAHKLGIISPSAKVFSKKNFGNIYSVFLPITYNNRAKHGSSPAIRNDVKELNRSHDGINDYPNMGDDINIEELRKKPNIKVDKDGNMEITDYMDPLLKKLPSYRTNIPMNIQGRMRWERERLLNMTDGERRWRAQWLKDQELKPHEPVNVPELYYFYNNIFKRAFHWPMDKFFELLTPLIGPTISKYGRDIIPRILWWYFVAILITYYAFFNNLTWETSRGLQYWDSRTPKYQGEDISFQKRDHRTFADGHFHERKVFPLSDL